MDDIYWLIYSLEAKNHRKNHIFVWRLFATKIPNIKIKTAIWRTRNINYGIFSGSATRVLKLFSWRKIYGKKTSKKIPYITQCLPSFVFASNSELRKCIQITDVQVKWWSWSVLKRTWKKNNLCCIWKCSCRLKRKSGTRKTQIQKYSDVFSSLCCVNFLRMITFKTAQFFADLHGTSRVFSAKQTNDFFKYRDALALLSLKLKDQMIGCGETSIIVWSKNRIN